jgi:hypothetical protein
MEASYSSQLVDRHCPIIHDEERPQLNLRSISTIRITMLQAIANSSIFCITIPRSNLPPTFETPRYASKEREKEREPRTPAPLAYFHAYRFQGVM